MSLNDLKHTPLGRIGDALINRHPAAPKATFTRPANTTQYAIGDAIYPPVPGEGSQIASLVFANTVPTPGANALVIKAKLIHFAAESTRLDSVLWLFDEAIATAPVDNAAFAPTNADMEHFVTTIAFPVGIVKTVGAHSVYEPSPNEVVTAAPASRSLHGYLVAGNAYTPVASEKFIIKLSAIPKDIGIF